MNQRAATREEVRFLRAQLDLSGVNGREAEAGLRSADVAKHELLLKAGGDPDQSGIVVLGVVRE